MYRDYSKDARKKEAYEFFIKNNFKATLIEDNDNFLVFDWKSPDSGNLSTRYILDKQRGTLIISGDSGDCIARWFGEVSAKQIECYVDSIDYFIKKFQTSSDTYMYQYEDVMKDFEAIKKEITENIFEYIKREFQLTDEDCEDFPKDICRFFDEAEDKSNVDGYKLDYDGYDLEKLLEELRRWALESSYEYTPPLNDDLEKFIEDFYCDDCWWETELASCGCRVSQRVYLWSVGLQMGLAQLELA